NADPRPGDLVFVSGRWIVDCGHKSYNSEIHPPAVIVPIRTVTYEGNQAALANIWVNGWYNGNPVDIDLFPPQRLSADHVLAVVKPLDTEAAFNVQITTQVFPSHVHIRFTAPHRDATVTDAGEMMWRSGLGYEGSWYLFWTR